MQWLNRFGMLLLLSLPATTLAYPHYGLYQPHRTLMYFTPNEGEESAAFQQQMLVHGCQMDERDLRSLVLDTTAMTDSRGLFSSNEISTLLEKFGIPSNEHIAVLIGKDGTEKFRWETEVNINELVDVIDEMPMRKQEIAQRGMRCSI